MPHCAPGGPIRSEKFVPPTRGSRQAITAAQGHVKKILEIIQSERPCTVHGLAVEFNLSRSHPQHLFKRKTRLGVGRCLTERDLQIAAHLGKRGQSRIEQIASVLGYEHTAIS